MAMRTAIVDELKRTLRKEGHTYFRVAHTLNLSVASVKRLFSSGSTESAKCWASSCRNWWSKRTTFRPQPTS
jgi:hypothetical protein